MTAEGTEARILLFRLGAAVHGCAIEAVREIVPLRSPTRLPGAPAWVPGIVNLRGTLVPIVELGRRLDVDYTPSAEGSIILMEHRERLLGVVSDEVLDVQDATVVPPPPGAAGAHEGMVQAMAEVGDGVVFLLDVPALMELVLA